MKFKVIAGALGLIILFTLVSVLMWHAFERENPLAMSLLLVVGAAFCFALGVGATLATQLVNSQVINQHMMTNAMENTQLLAQTQNITAKALASEARNLNTQQKMVAAPAQRGQTTAPVQELLTFDSAAFDGLD